jgi:RNA polymerase sigma-70 factor (ECF subfamily)
MTESSLDALRDTLVARYDDLRRRLTHRLGSAELAGEALQDTWLRLDQGTGLASVRSPLAYLFRMAFNIAIDRKRAHNRRLIATEVEALLDVADDAPDAARILEARREIAALSDIMAELPPRQRSILLAARLDGTPQRKIAEELGISLSLVEKELKLAQEYCAARLGRTRLRSTGRGDLDRL